MLDSSGQRQKVGLAIIAGGAAIAVVGLYLLTTPVRPLIGGVMFGTGVLDCVVGLWFLRG